MSTSIGSDHIRAHQSARPGFRPDIEGMRAIAVGLVVAFHFGATALPGGFIGVDVFFVISGYLITGILASEVDRTGKIDMLAFYARRSRRLLPVALTVTIATLIVSALILSPHEQQNAAKAAIASSLYVSNFWFMVQSTDYFSPESALNPFLHNWSLSVEEQFYFIWPALVLVSTRLFGAGKGRLWAILASLVVSLACCIVVTDVKQPWAFYGSPFRAWEFAIGALAGLAPAAKLLKSLTAARLVGVAGLAAVLIPALLLTEAAAFPGANAIIPCLGAAAVLFAGGANSGRGGAVLGFLSLAPFQFLGKRSYAIYLWHWPIIVFAKILKPELSLLDVGICIFLTVGLSTATLKLIETPVRDQPLLKRRSGLSIVLMSAVTALGAGLGGGAIMLASQAARAPEHRAAILTAESRSELSMRKGCILSLSEEDPNPCKFGESSSGGEYVLFGDSHAAQWFTPVRDLAVTRNANVVVYLKSSCAPAYVPVHSLRLRREFVECERWRVTAIGDIIKRAPQAVFISAFTANYIQGTGAAEHGRVSPEIWTSGLRKTIKQLSDAGIPVVLIGDTPFMRFDVPTCLGRSGIGRGGNPYCTQSRTLALNEPVAKAEAAAISGIPQAKYLSLNDVICDGVICGPSISGVVVYRDNNHISEIYAKSLSSLFKDRLGS